jgi:hypothetical protein
MTFFLGSGFTGSPRGGVLAGGFGLGLPWLGAGDPLMEEGVPVGAGDSGPGALASGAVVSCAAVSGVGLGALAAPEPWPTAAPGEGLPPAKRLSSTGGFTVKMRPTRSEKRINTKEESAKSRKSTRFFPRFAAEPLRDPSLFAGEGIGLMVARGFRPSQA